MNPSTISAIKYRNAQIKQAVESLIYVKDDKPFIMLENFALNFSKSYLYMGFTRCKKVRLGEINGNDIIMHFGKIENGKLYTEGHRYSTVLPPCELV